MSDYVDVAMEAAQVELGLILQELEAEAAAELDAAGRNFDSDTKQGLSSRVERRGLDLLGVVGTDAEHGIVVHEGRRPGKQPPFTNIHRWVEQKLGISEPPEYWKAPVTRAIMRKIGREGTEGTPFLRRPFEAKRPEVSDRIGRAVVVALNRQAP